MSKNIISRIDKAITELSLIKKELQSCEQQSMFTQKEKRTNPHKEDAIQIIDYLSDLRIKHKISKRALTANESRIRMVSNRLKESSLEDAKKVIDTRFHVWVNDDKQVQYLHIETLFRPTKYFKYVDDIERIEKSIPKGFTDNGSPAVVTGSWTD